MGCTCDVTKCCLCCRTAEVCHVKEAGTCGCGDCELCQCGADCGEECGHGANAGCCCGCGKSAEDLTKCCCCCTCGPSCGCACCKPAQAVVA